MKVSSSRIESICRSLQSQGDPVRIQGANASAQALIAAQLVSSLKGPWVFLLANDDSANEFASDLETLSEIVTGKRVEFCHFPTWDPSPYSPIAPSLRIRMERIALLAAIYQGKAPQAIITTIAALSQATLPKVELANYSITLKKGQDIESRERLAGRLVASGYLRADSVEDPGVFAMRGDIVDIFPPDQERPLRVEHFDGLIERIREFDPATQRTLGPPGSSAEISGLFIPPAREVLIRKENTAALRERLKARADDTGVTRGARDPLLAIVQNGGYPDHSDAWASFTYEHPETLWDHLGQSARIAWIDELSCGQSWDEFLAEQIRLSESAPEAGLILPDVRALFRWDESLKRSIRRESRLFLDRVQLSQLEDLSRNPGETEVPSEISTHHRLAISSNAELSSGGRHSLGQLEPQLKLWKKQGFKIIVLASTQSQLERIRFLLDEHGLNSSDKAADRGMAGLIELRIGSLSEGFCWPAEGLVLLTESEILGSRHKRKQRRQSKSESGSAAQQWAGLNALSDLGLGDLVVHIDHGMGRYQGLTRLNLSGAPMDFLQLEYANKDKLYLPVYRLNVIQKYAGSGDSASLDKLGAQFFARAKDKVKAAVKKLAIDLVKLYAERKVRPGVRFGPRDAFFREFEAKFQFDETPDQLKAIDQTLENMESGLVMDRLVCGDVGYGKTEVAMRAAFRAVTDGKQVALLVPTTVLAFQHEQSLRSRMKGYPIQIDAVSRFKSAKEQRQVLDSLARGKTDIIIGTHRLLSKDVRFRDLGLVIVDEEHRFGVEHKERLKALKTNTHVLTLTATPIPRTLHMALAGLRDISLIQTPPVDRLPIRTYVSKFDESLIKRAIEFELSRGGQVFFLHNRVDTIYELANQVRSWVPSARVGVGHGQMGEGELEKTMIDFYKKNINVLVCTTIIESGLDVPSANTILVNRADSLGLAQLYQIRGRVGRGQNRAYAYLLIPAESGVTEDAKRRLEVIQKFVELGSGFSIASHDLEIRGGGELLGPQQSGHIAAVGFDLYTELLEEAICELKKEGGAPDEGGISREKEPEIKAPFPAYLAEEYVPDIHQRLSLYRRFSGSRQESEVDEMEEELRDRFGAPPLEAQNLLWMIRVKLLLKRAGIEILTVGPERVSLVTGPQSTLDPSRVVALVASQPSRFQILPESKFVAQVATASLRDLYFDLETLFRKLE